ncbi:MAG: FAD-linked oxidase C-terminal domain-containing protein [Armatimonadota bacterium]|nr:FAD-linked oxidase C-terminal domain-containing protein [Armatimonadota bacterium]
MSPIVIDKLISIVGSEYVLVSDEDRLAYAYDSQMLEFPPDAVIRPRTADEISEILHLANEELVAVVPRGSGTGLSGGSVAPGGGVVLDLSRMNSILEIDSGNLHAVCEPGVITAHLAAEAEKQGLLYPPDPGSIKVSTLGGNVAENAGGLRAIKYGVTKNYLMQVRAVSPTGEEFVSGAKTRKCVAGYDLASLLCGSEGTLAVLTEITVRLVPYPKFRRALTAVFETASAAGGAVSEIMAAGLTPSTLEILDQRTIQVVEDYARLGLPKEAGALLLVEFDGFSEAAVTDETEAAQKILLQAQARQITQAQDDQEREKIWEARRVALAALARVRPTTILEDVTVPLPELSTMIDRIADIARKHSILIGTFGHAGDGNLHPTLLTDERDAEEMARVENAITELFDAALELGGTVSGEHGIGFTKAPFLRKEVGENTLEVMRRVKRSLDPNNILNPGKFL